MAVDTAVSALGADLKSDPFGIKEARQKSSEQTTKYEAAGTEEERIRKLQAEETKPFISKATDLLEKQKAMKTPELGALPEYKPTKIDPEEAKQAFQTLMTFSLIGGALTKQPMMAAMNNMTAALKGHMEGDKQRVDKEIKDFERNYKLAEGKRKAQLEEYNLAFSKNKNDLQAQMTEIELVAKKYGDEIGAQLAKKGDAKELMKHFDTLARTGQQAKATADRIATMGKGGSKGDPYGYAENITTAANEAASSMKNIMGLDVESTGGFFGGKQTSSMFTAPIDTFVNKLTPESVQRYNLQSGKLGYNLSQLMKAGRAVGVTEVAEMNKIIQIREGDTLETAATRLAEARQIAERAIEVRIASPKTTPELKEILKSNLKTINEVIPFTVDDINSFVRKKDKSKTFGEVLSDKYVQGEDTIEHPEDIQNILKKYK